MRQELNNLMWKAPSDLYTQIKNGIDTDTTALRHQMTSMQTQISTLIKYLQTSQTENKEIKQKLTRQEQINR